MDNLFNNPVQRFFDQLLEQKKSSKAYDALLDSRSLKEINGIVDSGGFVKSFVGIAQPNHFLLSHTPLPINNMLGI